MQSYIKHLGHNWLKQINAITFSGIRGHPNSLGEYYRIQNIFFEITSYQTIAYIHSKSLIPMASVYEPKNKV